MCNALKKVLDDGFVYIENDWTMVSASEQNRSKDRRTPLDLRLPVAKVESTEGNIAGLALFLLWPCFFLRQIPRAVGRLTNRQYSRPVPDCSPLF